MSARNTTVVASGRWIAVRVNPIGGLLRQPGIWGKDYEAGSGSGPIGANDAHGVAVVEAVLAGHDQLVAGLEAGEDLGAGAVGDAELQLAKAGLAVGVDEGDGLARALHRRGIRHEHGVWARLAADLYLSGHSIFELARVVGGD